MKCREITRSGSLSNCRGGRDLDEEITVYNLPEIRGLPTNGSQESNVVNEPNNEVITQGLPHNPVLPVQNIQHSDDNFPDSGISNTSASDAEVVIQVACEGNGQQSDSIMCPLEVPQFPQLSVECSPNKITKDLEENKTMGNSQSQIEQLVNVLVNALCNQENASETEEFCRIEVGEGDEDEVALHLSRELVSHEEESNELGSPLTKVRKLLDYPLEERPLDLIDTDSGKEREIECLTHQSSPQEIENPQNPYDTAQILQEEEIDTTNKLVKSCVQVECLPLKKTRYSDLLGRERGSSS